VPVSALSKHGQIIHAVDARERTASAAVAVDPAPYTTVDLAATSMLVVGTNIVAVQVLNSAIGSSDIIFSPSLSTIAPDFVPPTVALTNPASGSVFGAPAQIVFGAAAMASNATVTSLTPYLLGRGRQYRRRDG